MFHGCRRVRERCKGEVKQHKKTIKERNDNKKIMSTKTQTCLWKNKSELICIINGFCVK